MENTTLAVKDLILDDKDLKSLEVGKKVRCKPEVYEYQAVMQSGCDFAVRRTLKGRKSSSLLVILPSQRQYYVEEGKRRKKLSKSVLKDFLKGMSYEDEILLPDVSWLRGLNCKDEFRNVFLQTLGIPRGRGADTKNEAIRKGFFFLGTEIDPFCEPGFGLKYLGASGGSFRFDYAIDNNIPLPVRPGLMNDIGYDNDLLRPYRGYYNRGLPSAAGHWWNSYEESQALNYDMSPALYRYMIKFMASRRGVSIKKILAEVIPDAETVESMLFQSFPALAIIEKAYGPDVAKSAMRRFPESGIKDIIPYDQTGLVLYGERIVMEDIKRINDGRSIRVVSDDDCYALREVCLKYGMSSASFLKYLLDEPARQGYEHDMTMFMFQWGQALFIQHYIELPKIEKYPRELASTTIKLMSKCYDYADVIESKTWAKVVEHTKSLEYHDDWYKIIVPHCSADILKEAECQSNCLRSYGNSIINCETRICFLRFADPEKEDLPFVTIEVSNDNKLIQVKGRYNTNPPPDVWKFIEKWIKEKKIKDETGMNPHTNPFIADNIM